MTATPLLDCPTPYKHAYRSRGQALAGFVVVLVRILAHHQQPADLKRAQNVLTACSIARIFGSETASTSVNVGPTVEPPVRIELF